jgi:hypothetical protein
MNGELDEGAFQGKMLAVTTAYGKMWNTIKHQIKNIRNRPHFFSMQYLVPRPDDAEDSDDGTPDITMLGVLKYVRATGLFVTRITEVDEDTEEDTEIYNQVFVPGRA